MINDMTKDTTKDITKDMMLTTIDNPFDPFTQWDDWKRFDEDMKYFTCSYLARITKTSDDLSDADNEQEIENSINEIVNFNINGMYRKAYAKNQNQNDAYVQNQNQDETGQNKNVDRGGM